MRNIICIVCPNSCTLMVDEVSKTITGNKCKRGIEYALNELTAPKRSLCTTVKTSLKEYPVISVRTDGEIDKNKIFDLMRQLNKIEVKEYLKIGSVIIANVFGTDVNVITTTDMKGEKNV